MLFHLVIHKDIDSTYGVTIPALAGCFSFGDTLEEATRNSKEAISLHLEGFLNDDLEPEISPISFDEILENPDYQNAIYIAVEVDISAHTLKPERFNVSWPKYLIKQIDQFTAKNHDNRSNFLAKAAKAYINAHEADKD